MQPKLIKNDTDYEAALGRVEALMEEESLDQAGQDELELLGFLVSGYEDDVFPLSLPSPVDAIRFRMEQQGLKQRDLIPYIGNASRVSEILSGKRTLSLSMIRKLHRGLGIPAEVLLQEEGAELPPENRIDWQRFPLAEMRTRGWFGDLSGTLAEVRERAEELITALVAPVGADILQPSLCRQQVRSGREPDPYALLAWRVRVCSLAASSPLPARYVLGSVTEDLVEELVHLSYLDTGPLLAKEFLAKNGIHLVIESHLPKTYLDGAAMTLGNGTPVIALTLRHDRLDNFWFTLCHELAHVALHLEGENDLSFFDDVDAKPENDLEVGADRWAADALIPPAIWRRAGLNARSTPQDVRGLARKTRVGTAVVAGRLRRETGNCTLMTRLVGNKKVRELLAS